jgi:hypothetical protein
VHLTIREHGVAFYGLYVGQHAANAVAAKITRPTKLSDTRAARFGKSISVELDAIEPRRLRSLVERAILKHLPKKKYEELMEQEREEQEEIRRLVDEIET